MKEKRAKPFRWSPDLDQIIKEGWPDVNAITKTLEDELVFVTPRQVYERGYRMGLSSKKLQVKKSKLLRVTKEGVYNEYEGQREVIALLRRPWK